MKAKKLLGLVALLTLVGCSGGGKTTEVSQSVTTSQEVSNSSVEERDQQYYELPSNYKNEYLGFSYSDSLTDIAIDRQFIVGVDQRISFGFSAPFSNASTVESSNEKVFTVEKVTEYSYILHIVHAGQAYITIRDGNGLIRYRHVVYTNDGMTKAEMSDYLSEVDHWVAYGGFGDNYTMTFLFDDTVTISGSITGSAFAPFTCGFKLIGETEEEYRYSFTGDEAKKSGSSLTGFNISKCGDIMYLQYTNGTAALMFPNTRTFD